MKYLFFFLSIFFISIIFIQCESDGEITVVIERKAPNIVFIDEPELIIIPDTYVYYVSISDNDIFFYEGYWWRPYRSAWYRADIYSGPWIIVERTIVPHVIIGLPPSWRHFPSDTARVRWNDVREHWKTWEHEKYWEQHKWKKTDAVNKQKPRDKDRDPKKEDQKEPKNDNSDKRDVKNDKKEEPKKDNNNKPNPREQNNKPVIIREEKKEPPADNNQNTQNRSSKKSNPANVKAEKKEPEKNNTRKR